MTSGNYALALALGAGGGLALWYLLDKGQQNTSPSPSPSPSPPSASSPTAQIPPTTTTRAATVELSVGPAVLSTRPTAPCQLRLTGAGLTMDGRATDIPSAVAQCKGTGRADVQITKDAPAVVYAQLVVALAREGITIAPRRNGRTSARSTLQRRRHAHVELADFAATVVAIAQQIDPDPTPEGLARGRFGLRKVFIAALRRALRDTEYAQLPRTTVDALLVEAMREGLLRLARVDLAAALDPAEVRESEIRTVNAVYHFVVAERLESVDVGTNPGARRKRGAEN